ncbi:hypothetical protein CS8_093840 [Cupriavidus sp. 8B]
MAQSELARSKEGSATLVLPMAGLSKTSCTGGVATVHRIGKASQSKISAHIYITNTRARGAYHRTRRSSHYARCRVFTQPTRSWLSSKPSDYAHRNGRGFRALDGSLDVASPNLPV